MRTKHPGLRNKNNETFMLFHRTYYWSYQLVGGSFQISPSLSLGTLSPDPLLPPTADSPLFLLGHVLRMQEAYYLWHGFPMTGMHRFSPVEEIRIRNEMWWICGQTLRSAVVTSPASWDWQRSRCQLRCYTYTFLKSPLSSFLIY